MNDLNKKSSDPALAWKKIQKFCVWRERCHQETRERLYQYGLYQNDVEELLTRLIESDFVNEERFSKSFARGKFKSSKWGRVKIEQALKKRQISPFCISKAMEEIEDLAYVETLKQLIEKKRLGYKSLKTFELRGKIANFCIAKGYESDLVWQQVKVQIT